jgi:hypothetical protein
MAKSKSLHDVQPMDAAERKRIAQVDDGTVVRPVQAQQGNVLLRNRVAANGHIGAGTRAHVAQRTQGK